MSRFLVNFRIDILDNTHLLLLDSDAEYPQDDCLGLTVENARRLIELLTDSVEIMEGNEKNGRVSNHVT